MAFFVVKFSRIGNDYRGYVDYFKAPNVEALEKPIQTLVDALLPNQNTEVTIEPHRMVGQLDFGLKGNFEIIAEDD